MPIRVYLVDDHPVIRETLGDYLRLNPDIEICGMAENVDQAIAALPAANPSLILLDLSLPGRNGLELLAEIDRRWPCVVLSGHREKSYVGRAMAAGARGYVLKGRPREILEAIETVGKGEIYLSDSIRYALDWDSDDGSPT